MGIITIEDKFDYNFKEVIKAMKEDYPALKGMESEDFQDAICGDERLREYFAHEMFRRAFEYGGDRMFCEEGD